MRKSGAQSFEDLRRHAAFEDAANAVLLHAHSALKVAPGRHFDKELGWMVFGRHASILHRRLRDGMMQVICVLPYCSVAGMHSNSRGKSDILLP